MCVCLHVPAFHCVTLKQGSSSSVEFPCELMCVPIPIIAVGSSVLLILCSEDFFFFFKIIWVTRMQLEALQSVLLGEHRNGCQCHSMVDLFIFMKTQHCSVSVCVSGRLAFKMAASC